MKLIITGGYGFIGSNFINIASKFGHDILNIDNVTYAANRDNIRVDNIDNIEIDIADYNRIEPVILDFSPDAVIHFAAESHVDNSIANPHIFLNTNIFGTYNLLQSCSKLKNDFHYIHISTDEVFGELGSEGFFTEETRYDPKSPYSASKASSDHLVRAWSNTYNFPATIVNCSNNYGPNQHKEKLIPTIIMNSLSQKTIPVYGNGLNVREWIFVEDYCNAVFAVINKREKSLFETFCVGSGHELTNIDIVKKICNLINENFDLSFDCLELITFVEDRKGHDFRYAIDSSKIKNDLNFSIDTNFDEALMKTILWYKDKS